MHHLSDVGIDFHPVLYQPAGVQNRSVVAAAEGLADLLEGVAGELAAAGVRFVSVYDKVTNGLDNWDTHVANFDRLKEIHFEFLVQQPCAPCRVQQEQ
jgi:hypothetical protein